MVAPGALACEVAGRVRQRAALPAEPAAAATLELVTAPFHLLEALPAARACAISFQGCRARFFVALPLLDAMSDLGLNKDHIKDLGQMRMGGTGQNQKP